MHHPSIDTTRTAPTHSARSAIVGIVAATVAVVLGVAVAATPAGAAAKLTMYGGYSFGTVARVGSYATSGNSAVTTLCTSRAGVTHTNHSSATTIPNVGTVGAVSTQTSSQRPSSGPVSLARTTTAGMDLFGMIRASAITTTTRVARTASGIVRSGQTSFVGLRISGHNSPPAHPAVDQKITIPGVATLQFNHQVRSQQFGAYRMVVTALTVTIPKTNSLHLPAGRILIGRGGAALHRQTYANAQGYAFGTVVQVAKLSGSGRTAVVYLPCGGSNGATLRNHLSGALVKNVLTSGDVRSSGYSSDKASGTLARTQNTVARAALFGSAIKASDVHVVATATRDKSGLHRSNTVSLGTLTINGQRHSGTAPANTKMVIPQLGTVWLHRVIRTPNGLVVRGVDLVLSVTKNGLKKGTELIIGAAYAGVSPS